MFPIPSNRIQETMMNLLLYPLPSKALLLTVAHWMIAALKCDSNATIIPATSSDDQTKFLNQIKPSEWLLSCCWWPFAALIIFCQHNIVVRKTFRWSRYVSSSKTVCWMDGRKENWIQRIETVQRILDCNPHFATVSPTMEYTIIGNIIIIVVIFVNIKSCNIACNSCWNYLHQFVKLRKKVNVKSKCTTLWRCIHPAYWLISKRKI